MFWPTPIRSRSISAIFCHQKKHSGSWTIRHNCWTLQWVELGHPQGGVGCRRGVFMDSSESLSGRDPAGAVRTWSDPFGRGLWGGSLRSRGDAAMGVSPIRGACQWWGRWTDTRHCVENRDYDLGVSHRYPSIDRYYSTRRSEALTTSPGVSPVLD